MVYLLKSVIFHGYVSHNQMVKKKKKTGLALRPSHHDSARQWLLHSWWETPVPSVPSVPPWHKMSLATKGLVYHLKSNDIAQKTSYTMFFFNIAMGVYNRTSNKNSDDWSCNVGKTGCHLHHPPGHHDLYRCYKPFPNGWFMTLF